jgi:hypothetical protein
MNRGGLEQKIPGNPAHSLENRIGEKSMNQVPAYLGAYPIQYFSCNLRGYRVRRDTIKRARYSCPGEKPIKQGKHWQKKAKIGPHTDIR